MGFSIQRFKEFPIIGILRGIASERAAQVFKICREEGVTTLEITMNTPGAAAMIQAAALEFSTELNIGAGTVRTLHELDTALNAGAQFIVTPIVNPDVIKSCVAQQIPVFPGAYTPTEIFTAWQLGATAVKIFPATTGGLAHLKAIQAPLEMIPLIPTGGVTPENLAAFLDAGVYGIGMGSQLFPEKIIAQENWAQLRLQIRQVKQAFEHWKRKTQDRIQEAGL